MFKSGFVSIIGKPNAGKSTLLNAFIGKKVAITSPKPQTTRNKINGILTEEDSQIVFIDTPGIHKTNTEIGKFMNKTAYKSSKGSDAILFLIPGDKYISENDRHILRSLEEQEVPVICVVTKIDLISSNQLIQFIDQISKEFSFTEIVPVSSMKKFNLDRLKTILKSYLKEGPKFYEDGVFSDQPDKFLVREIIREKVLYFTHEEIPHSVAILIDEYEHEDDVLYITSSICVERSSQKGIIIGQGGQMIKKIGTAARRELKFIFDEKIHLELFVKVVEKWRNKPNILAKMGYK